MDALRGLVIVAALVAALSLVGWQEGPAREGPETAGKDLDRTVEPLTR